VNDFNLSTGHPPRYCNLLATRKREHSRKPDEIYHLIEQCSPAPYLRFPRPGWHQWGNEDVEENSSLGVAMRKGHIDPQMRLLEGPKGYGASPSRP
jgi:N6-adenosine-specific RNA methylase IME4